jgi:hypothetical protein
VIGAEKRRGLHGIQVFNRLNPLVVFPSVGVVLNFFGFARLVEATIFVFSYTRYELILEQRPRGLNVHVDKKQRRNINVASQSYPELTFHPMSKSNMMPPVLTAETFLWWMT